MCSHRVAQPAAEPWVFPLERSSGLQSNKIKNDDLT